MSEEQLIKTPGVFGENGNFLLERELGRGGMGGVYMGRDKMLDRPVAVKVMLREYGSDAEFVEKFKKEAQAAARLIHPNIAQIYSYGISDGMPYIAMELVPGGSLEGLMRTHGANIDVPRVMKIGEQVAQALRCAADQGLVHGDVKPENVLLDANGNAKLVDFGLAAMQKDTDEIWGTPYYIAPEKVKKQAVDYRADMYSLGGTLYHALTGVAPFEGDDAASVVRKRFQGPPARPSEVRPGLSPQIDYLVMKMLEADPYKRYPSFEALLADFKKVMTTGLAPVSAQPQSSGGKIKLSTSRSKLRPTKMKLSSSSPDEGGEEQPSPAEAASAGAKLTLKPRRKFTIHHHPATPAEEGGGEDEVAELDPVEGSPDSAIPDRLRIPGMGDDEFADDEGGTHFGLVVGIVLGVIGLAAGGLFWYWSAFHAGESASAQARVDSGFETVRRNYSVLTTKVNEFQDQLDKIASEATNECQRITDEMARKMEEIYPEEYIGLLKPPKTAMLLKAEAELERELAPPADTNAAPAAATNVADTAAAAPKAAAGANAAPGVPQFRPPVGDEADPMSPEHEDYMKEKAEWEAKQKAKSAAPAAQDQGAAAPAADAAKTDSDSSGGEDGEVLDKPTCIEKMNKIWEATYDCQGAVIVVQRKLNKIKADIASKSQMPAPEMRSEATLKAFNDAQMRLDEDYKALKNSDEVTEHVQKINNLLKSRGKKALKDCHDQVKRIKEKRYQKKLEEENATRIKEENERRERELRERREKEVAQAKEIYEGLVSEGHIRTLDWRGCTNKLLLAKSNMSSGEGKAEADFQILKIKMMADVQGVIQRNIVGWTFKLGEGRDSKAKPIKDWTVTGVDDRHIFLRSRKGEKREITWMRFYNDYHANFSALINKYIRNGDRFGNPKLRKLDRVNAMIGAALTLEIICSNDATSEGFANNMAKQALKAFPEMTDTIKRIWPDKDFSDVEAEAQSENL